jgi:hypothetical protein
LDALTVGKPASVPVGTSVNKTDLCPDPKRSAFNLPERRKPTTALIVTTIAEI